VPDAVVACHAEMSQVNGQVGAALQELLIGKALVAAHHRNVVGLFTDLFPE